MYVCICNAVTDSQIKAAQKAGHSTMAEITAELGVGNCCGRCVETAEDILMENGGVQQYKPQLGNLVFAPA